MARAEKACLRLARDSGLINKDVSACSRQPRRAASMAAMSIFFIVIIASKAHFASPPPAASGETQQKERPHGSVTFLPSPLLSNC